MIKEEDFLKLNYNDLKRIPRYTCSVYGCGKPAEFKWEIKTKVLFEGWKGFACEEHKNKLRKEV